MSSEGFLATAWGRTPSFGRGGWLLLLLPLALAAFGAQDIEDVIVQQQPGEMVTKEGRVAFQQPQKAEVPALVPQTLDFGEALRTHAAARATVRFLDQSRIRMRELTRLQVVPRSDLTNAPGLRLYEGQIYVTSRGTGSRAMPIETPHAKGVPRGTEFLVSVDPQANRTELTMFDGEAELSDGQTKAVVRSGQQGTVVPGEGIRVRSIVEARNIIQWWIYYPGILDPDELNLPPAEQASLADSLAAYRAGNLAAALERYPGYPTPTPPPGDAGKAYLAGLLLSVGAVDKAEVQLNQADSNAPPARALHTMIGAVTRPLIGSSGESGQSHSKPPARNPELPRSASELLALSYAHQSTNNLKAALDMARAATERSSGFGFAWARVAELEFSFGRIGAARKAVERALQLGPQNAQAHATHGFLLAAENRLQEAIAAFNRAIELDSGLGNAWLGRGLCKRRAGWFTSRNQPGTRNPELGTRNSDPETSSWLSDLQAAAALEPRRSLLRSYLGKAFTDAGNARLARKELDYARELDPNDPTPWLYSALLQQDEYRTADAIRDLEESQRLNDHRAVYRSRLLLDQDQAVRSANLANLFEDADMRDVSVRESARAVSLDYANYSAHLNLANSIDQWRDPTRFNLRHESEWFNELLLANLLAPVGGTPLSQHISLQEYSSLFERDRLGVVSQTEYRSDGQVQQVASQYGRYRNTAYAFDLDYQHNAGVRPNNELERFEFYGTLKHQLTPQDSLFFLTKIQNYHSGDNFQYYDPSSARTNFSYDEYQTPGMLLAGYHHQWSPGVHTLLFGGRLANDQDVSDTQANQLIAVVNPAGMFDPTNVVPFDVTYDSAFETYTAELNQIFQRERHTDILGARFQGGTFNAHTTLDNPPPPFSTNGLFALPEVSATDADFQRLSLYAYHHWEIVDGLLLIGGLAYDDLEYPANFRRPPLASGQSHKERWSPKAGLVWDLTPRTRVRGMFSEAVGGVSYDESVRLEPTQIAGFGQSFRSVISESLIGSVEAPDYQIAGGALDLKPWTNAWLSLQGQALRGEVSGGLGLFEYNAFPTPPTPPATPAQTTAQFDYHEWQTRAVFNQILGREWFLEARFQYTQSELERGFPTIPATGGYDRDSTTRADLYDVRLAATWRHPCGFFARGEFWWFSQDLSGSTPQPPGDSFPQVNLYVGYGFRHRRAELTLGVLNLTGEDYNLSPLNYYLELPREPVFYTRFRFNF